MSIRDCMSSDVLTISSKGHLRAAHTVKDADTGGLPISENDRVLGMYSGHCHPAVGRGGLYNVNPQVMFADFNDISSTTV